MKKEIFVGLLLSTVLFTTSMSASAVSFKGNKPSCACEKTLKQEEKDIRKFLDLELSLANKHDLEGLEKLYSDKFVNNDGFNKKVYLKLIKDTWETYSDIKYTVDIGKIQINNRYATVEAQENAVAISYDTINDAKTVGELNGTSKCIYHLEKIGNQWYFTAEDVLEETSMLKYGDTRYLKIELNTPKLVPADEYYTATLTMKAPDDVVAIATINRENLTYPQQKSEEAYRVMPEDNILERMFKANSDNLNEYNIVSIATARSFGEGEDMKILMSGAGFIMTRVNVIPKNKFIDFEEENGKAE